jgi:hypothetical protein
VSYVAYRLKQHGLSQPWSPIGNGSDWDENARSAHVQVDGSPVVGSIAQWDGGDGHIAYVEQVTSTYIIVSEDNFVTNTSGYSSKRKLDRNGTTFAAAEFIHLPGKDGIGVWRPSQGRFYLDNNRDGHTDSWIYYGAPNTDRPITGDWDGG